MDFERLMLQLKSNDRQKIKAAYASILKNWGSITKSTLNRMGCKHTGDFNACFNEGFLAIKENARQEKIKANTIAELKSYFISICKNYWLNHYELNPIKNKLSKGELSGNEVEETKNDKSLEIQIQKLVGKFLNLISERCKERILYSKYFSAKKDKIDISAAEVAEDMKYSSARAATKALNKCMEQLKNKISEELDNKPQLKIFLLDQLGIKISY